MKQEIAEMNTIVPTKNNSVPIPSMASQSFGQTNQYGQQQQQQQQTPIAYASNLFQNRAVATGMINWEAGAASGYQDPYLAELSEAASLNGGNAELLVKHKVSQAIEFYMRSLLSKQGVLYEIHSNAIKLFRIDKYTRQECPVHSKFIDSITRNPQYMQMIVRNSAAFFGYGLVDTVRKSGSLDSDSSPFNQNNLSCSTESATRTVLFMEMVNWLDKSKAGRELSLNLPVSITETLMKLENIREFSNKVFAYFDATSPYIELSLTKPNPEAYAIINPTLMEDVFDDSQVSYSLPSASIGNWLVHEANRYAKDPEDYSPPPIVESEEVTWGRKTTELDLAKLTRKNITRYDFRNYFKPIPTLPNTYVINPHDWIHIESLYTDAPIGVWEGTVVVVEADLDALNRGGMVDYQVEIHKLPGRLTMTQVLTDPSKILPVLKEDTDAGLVVVDVPENKAIQTVNEKQSFDIIPEVAEVEAINKLAIVSTKDKIFSAKVETVIEESTIISAALTGNKRNTCSVIVVEGKTNFTMQDPAETEYIKETYSDLFMRKAKPTKLSWIKLMNTLIRLTEDSRVSEGVKKFLSLCTTQQLNSVLSGSYGFDLNKDSDNFLKLDDIVEDFDDFVEYARENSTQLFEDMHSITNNLLLANSFVLIEDALVNAQSMPDSTILRQRSLYLGREFVLYGINSEITPKFVSGEKTNVNRSFFPALFTILDKSTNQNKGQLLRFNNDEKLWLAQYSAFTSDFITLRVLDKDSMLPWTEFA